MNYHRRKLKKILYASYFVLFTLLGCCSICHAKNYYNDTSKSKVEIVENILGYSLEYVSNKLKDEFNVTSNEELGVNFIQKMYEKFKYTSVVPDVDKSLKKVADKLESKLSDTFSFLNKMREVIETFYYKTQHNLRLLHLAQHSFVTPCKELKSELEEFDIVIEVVNSSSPNIFDINDVFQQKTPQYENMKSAIKQTYFLSTFDVNNASSSSAAISKCMGQDHSLIWKTYVSHIIAKPRNIMLLLDHGGSLSKQQFRIVKAVAKQMISMLREEDRVGLLALSDDWSTPYFTDQCLMPNQAPPISDDAYMIAPATKHNKNLLMHFIDTLSKGNGATNHSLGFQQALETIKSSNITHDETVMILYISRGLLSSLTEAKTVLETIAYYPEDVTSRVIINTCAVIDESKPVMYETHFLRDIALRNYSKYNIPLNFTLKGIMLTVNSTHNVGLAVARFYSTLNPADNSYNLEPKISFPVWDDISKDIAVTATVPCGTNGEIGMLGVDLYFSNLVEDVAYFSNYPQYTYAFVIDNRGFTIMHPSYPRPTMIMEQPLFVDIIHLEKVPDFTIVRNLVLTEKKGKYTLKTKTESVHYTWQKISTWYIVCIVTRETDTVLQRPYKVSWFPSSSGAELVHYRLDLLSSSTRLCRHLNQVSTLDAGSLYLSSSCFQSPLSHAHSSSLSSVQTYMAYLKDNTRLLANPGLRDDVRDDVAAMAHVLEYLRNQHLQGAKARYIVRRYLTSPSGVIQLFPGALLASDLEPTKRNWYLRAMEHKYKTILTPPYLDAGGAGYIITLAYGTSNIVSAMDVTFGYVYKLMLDHMPFCTELNIKCFMMDDRGYLIYHPNLIDPNGHGPIEQQHIIHKESLVANDILNHKSFVKKMLCNNYADDTIQRYYWLNTSLDRVLSNAIHGEHSVKYQVSAIPGTNIFVGVVNATGEIGATFCPCSMVDRLCLNCKRMEQRECECPCECPLNLDTCTHPNRTYIENPLCTTNPEQSLSILSDSDFNISEQLDPCLPISCEGHLTHETCLGVLGCEWCKIDVDGTTLLASPFCTSIQTCFNGILGSPTPYGDSADISSNSEDLMGTTYSPVGPVIGSVFGVCLGLVLLFFCYRSYTSPSIERFYLTSAQENRVRMSDVNISDDYRELDNHQDKLLQDTKKPEPVSPYCVSTGYRRPPTAIDSDHGYSTMTPHDESEHLSFAPLELDSLEDECISDATSINTSVSSRQPQARLAKVKMLSHPIDLQVTNLPNRNCIIAPVTVHRNMETTQ